MEQRASGLPLGRPVNTRARYAEPIVCPWAAKRGHTIMLLVKSSCPCNTILAGTSSGARKERVISDAHHESDGEHETAEDFDDPRIGRSQPCGAALENLGEQSTEGEHGTGEELSSSDIIVNTSRDDVA